MPAVLRAPMSQRMTRASRRLCSSASVFHQRRGRTVFWHEDLLWRWSRWCRKGDLELYEGFFDLSAMRAGRRGPRSMHLRTHDLVNPPVEELNDKCI